MSCLSGATLAACHIAKSDATDYSENIKMMTSAVYSR
jgi:hypothetical protein